jgi:hypothetical protein
LPESLCRKSEIPTQTTRRNLNSTLLAELYYETPRSASSIAWPNLWQSHIFCQPLSKAVLYRSQILLSSPGLLISLIVAMKRKSKFQLAEQKEPCYMLRLPLEILAEILSYTRTPDILALARTSKHYCAILAINLSSQYIWKKARARFTPLPIPEPTSNFTECSFAAFLFDNGVCEV